VFGVFIPAAHGDPLMAGRTELSAVSFELTRLTKLGGE